MREQDSVPEWALEHIRGQLQDGEEVINAVAFRKGLFQGLVLLNTSKGAALVTKTGIGAPHSALLTYPRDLMTFTCRACEARTLVIDVDPPAKVHCSHCGAEHRLLEPGETEETAAGMLLPAAEVSAFGRGGVPVISGDYTLYGREEEKEGGRKRTEYFFSKLAPRDAREVPLPAGHDVVLGRDGVPVLRRTGGKRAKKATQKRAKKTTRKATKKAPRKAVKKATRKATKKARKATKPPKKTSAKKRTAKKATKKTPKQTSTKAAPKRRAVKRARPAATRSVKAGKKPSKAGGRKSAAAAKKPSKDDAKYAPQCAALSSAGKQCRNSARAGSKYCASHKGYSPPSLRQLYDRRDTKPRVKGAKDTLPAFRKRSRPKTNR